MSALSSSAIFYLAAWSVIIPRISVGGLFLGVDDALALTMLPLILIGTIADSGRRVVVNYWIVLFLFLAFVGLFLAVGTVNSAIRLGEAQISTELWQYLKRLVFLAIGFHFVSAYKKNEEKALRCLIFLFLSLLLIGLFQLIGGMLGDVLAGLYGRTPDHIEKLVNRSFGAKRVFGVAGMSTAWGGFCVFIFSIMSAFSISGYFAHKKITWLINISIFLSVLNILFSGSRGAILALVLTSVLLLCFFIRNNKILLTKKLYIVHSILILFLFITLAFSDKVLNLVYRFSVLIDTAGGGRDRQIVEGLGLIVSGREWAFGVSNPVQRELAVGHGVEVEIFYLFINYGAVGLFLISAILLTLMGSAIKLLKSKSDLGVAVGLGLIVSMIGYFLFSFAYFVFQEIVVGVTFWLFAGIALGIHQNMSNRKLVQHD